MSEPERLAKLAGIHGNIARDVWPKGARLECARCGAVIDATPEKCGRYLREGWPTHCGKTMELADVTP